MKYGDLTKAQRWAIADKLAEERLPLVNNLHKKVIPKEGLYVRYGKRAIDTLIAATALTVLAPLNLVVCIGTYLTVGRPLLFKQMRSGKDAKPFTLVKFRNMTNETDERGELLPAEQRVTSFGRFVRGTSLDELLNFVPILKGEMSVIGPRPLPPEYVHRYSQRHYARLLVRPGLECPPRAPLDHVWTWQEQFENDVWYVENVGLRTDIVMFFNLIRFAFDRKTSKARSTGNRGTFMGYSKEGIAITLEQVPQEYIDWVLRRSEADRQNENATSEE